MKLEAKRITETKTYQEITYEVEVTPEQLVSFASGDSIDLPEWWAQYKSADPGTLEVEPMNFRHTATKASTPEWTEPMLKIRWRCSHLEEKGGPEDDSGDEPRSVGVDQRERSAR